LTALRLTDTAGRSKTRRDDAIKIGISIRTHHHKTLAASLGDKIIKNAIQPHKLSQANLPEITVRLKHREDAGKPDTGVDQPFPLQA